MFQICGLFVGEPKNIEGTEIFSSIGQRRVVENLVVFKDGIKGDRVEHVKFHGGPDRVLHQYPSEHYTYWGEQFKKKRQNLISSSMGENLTSKGLLEKEVCVGDIYQIGSVVAQVTEPRKPCGFIDLNINIKGLFKKIEKKYTCGWFYKILEEGVIDQDSQAKKLESGDQKFNLVSVMSKTLHEEADKDYLEELIKVVALSSRWRNRIVKTLNSK